ncbi:MAG: rRNA maturation RNase YbeY [Methylococcaceae bacterium]|nr:rRNA maturation RNase YbeY [Methylococcaceae bacterium]MCI0734050.1 rRNA maturation RNase YbeY [Methylococcaceae bacterium]
MNRVEIQRACEGPGIPDSEQFLRWATAVLEHRVRKTESVIRLVDAKESAALNRDYRKQDGPTNVLSFTYGPIGDLPMKLLGDVVICAPLVAAEAAAQQKDPEAHWAHMVVHGLLHLLGYDHVRDSDASQMESLEFEILSGLGYPDPYREAGEP